MRFQNGAQLGGIAATHAALHGNTVFFCQVKNDFITPAAALYRAGHTADLISIKNINPRLVKDKINGFVIPVTYLACIG